MLKRLVLVLGLAAVQSFAAAKPIAEEFPLGTAKVRLALSGEWQARYFKDELRVMYRTVSDDGMSDAPMVIHPTTGFGAPDSQRAAQVLDAKLRRGVAEFHLTRLRLPEAAATQSREAITDALVLQGEMALQQQVFGERVLFRRHDRFISETGGKQVFWYEKRRGELRRSGVSYANVGVIFGPDWANERVVYVLVGFEVNRSSLDRPLHFEMLGRIIEALSIPTKVAGGDKASPQPAG